MHDNVNMFGVPQNVEYEEYFNRKMKNFYLANKMENSVKSYEIEQVLNVGKRRS